VRDSADTTWATGLGGAVADAAGALVGSEPRLAAARQLVDVVGDTTVLGQLVESVTGLLQVTSGQISLMTDVQVVLAGVGDSRAGTTGELADVLCSLTLTGGAPLAVQDAASDERTRELPGVRSGAVRAYLGVPVRDSAGLFVGSVSVWSAQPRAWTATDAELVSLVAQAVGAQLQLRSLASGHASQLVRWALAVDSGQVGSFDWDLESGRLHWDERMRALFGSAADQADDVAAVFRERVHPADRERVAGAIDAAVATCGELQVEYRVLLPGGSTRWIRSQGKALAGPTGQAVRLMGAAYDTTEMASGRSRTDRVVEAMPSGFVTLDDGWRFTVVNAAAERLVGLERAEMLGRTMWEVFPDTVGTEVEAAYRRAVATQTPQTLEAYYPAPLDSWYEILAWPTPEGLSLYFADVDDRKRAVAVALQASTRLALLAEVNMDLLRADDVPVAVAAVPARLVPSLADGCFITLLGEDGRPRDVSSWHADPVRREALQEYLVHRLEQMPAGSPIARVLATGEPVRSSAAEVDRLLTDDGTRRLLAGLGADDAVVLPIRGRADRVIGALSLFSGAGRPTDPDDQHIAAEIAARVGLALENDRLVRAQSQLAEGLQRNLLTAPPEPDHAHIVVRYVPATESARVGGDWYDAFMQRDGATVLVIGDVAGHDVAAAADMAQLCSLLRGIATYTSAGPAEVLRGLDSSMRLLEIGTLATAVVARLEQTQQEFDQGVTRLVWSNAGHPPPLVLHPDGRQQLLDARRAELLLGVDADTTRTEQTVVLERDATVLLYSDGLVERRDADLDTGLARLQQAVAELAGSTLDELCDGLIERLVDGQPDDDVALAAIRLFRQDQPRPAEAGPNDVPPGVPPDHRAG